MSKIKTLLFLLLICPILLFSQSGYQPTSLDDITLSITTNLSGVVTEKIPSIAKVNDKIKVKGFFQSGGYVYALIETDGQLKKMSVKHTNRIDLDYENLQEFWLSQAVMNNTYDQLAFNPQYDLRKELEEEALNYRVQLNRNGLIFEDEYIESYLYQLIYKLYPRVLNDGRTNLLNISIVKNASPNAYVFSNGSLYITTGLLSTINTEEELLAILAHEIAHFVLDHSVVNINKQVAREKRASFWVGLSTLVAAGADIYMATENENYAPGTLTISTAIIASSIAESVMQRMGVAYSREQEFSADECASELLKYLNYNPKSLGTALAKLKNYSILNGNYSALYASGSHPSLSARIAALNGTTDDLINGDYDSNFSLINTFNAQLEYQQFHFETCANLTRRNIKASVATEDDYLLLAKCILRLYDTQEKNLLALDYLKKASNLNVTPLIETNKQISIVYGRLNNKTEALLSLDLYINDIDIAYNEDYWKNYKYYLAEERSWAQKMKLKFQVTKIDLKSNN
jgi:Zn-dependent protease with chaperone function